MLDRREGHFWQRAAVLDAAKTVRVRAIEERERFRIVTKVRRRLPRARQKEPVVAAVCVDKPLADIARHIVGTVGPNPLYLPTGARGIDRPAIFVNGRVVSQLWLFWVAPSLEQSSAGLISTAFFAVPQQPIREEISKRQTHHNRPLAGHISPGVACRFPK